MPTDFKYSSYHITRYNNIKKRYVDEFFYGDENNFNSREQPFISFKHIFRQLIAEYLIPVRAEQARVEGCDVQTIYHSLHKAEIKLHPKLEQAAKDFLLEKLTQDPITYVKTKLQSHQTRGYTTDDIARHYLVHDSVVHSILANKPVDPKTIEYLYRQCVTADPNN